MKKTIMIAAVLMLALPLAANAHPHRDHHDSVVSISGDSSFEIEDGTLFLSHKSRWSRDRVEITEGGDLKINGDRIKTGKRERGMLREFYRESAKLEEMALAIADDATKIAAASTKYAVAQVAAALRELSDGDGDRGDDRDDAIEAEFEAEIEEIEKFADKIEGQADHVSGLADDLQEAVPELGELEWFLDD